MTEDFYCEEVFSGKTPVEKIAETENVLAYYHTRPFWEHHAVVVPKAHIDSFLTLDMADLEFIKELFGVIQKVAGDFQKKYGAARIITNLGRYQDSKHLHFHVNSGEKIR